MRSFQSNNCYNRLPDDELELIDLNDNKVNSDDVSFAEKVETNVCTSLCDKYNEWVRKRKEREEEKQKIKQEQINKEQKIKEMMLELVKIAKVALEDRQHAPISEAVVNEVLTKYGNIGHTKKLYNITDICAKTTPRQGWEGLCQEGWKVCIDRKDVNELVMVVTKCMFTGFINTYELILKNGEGYLSECGENGQYAYVPDRNMKHFVFLVTSAGISTLDVYEGNPNSHEGRESIQWEYQRRMNAHKQKVSGGLFSPNCYGGSYGVGF